MVSWLTPVDPSPGCSALSLSDTCLGDHLRARPLATAARSSGSSSLRGFGLLALASASRWAAAAS